MSELSAIQSGFAAALAPGGKVGGAAALFRGDAAGVSRRLGIYRGNAQANAVKALGAVYPVLAQIVGTEFFEGLARAYAKSFPSASGDLNEYGEAFGEFLAGFEPAQELPYLPDVARLEWRAHKAHYATDHLHLDPARLAQIAEDDYAALRLVLHPACALLQSPWPLARIWEVHQADFSGEFEVDLDAGPSCALVYRPELRVCVTELSPGEQAFMAGASRGETLGEALNAAMAAEAGFMLDAAFTRWVADRVIVDFKTT
jgi:hypothetical protein